VDASWGAGYDAGMPKDLMREQASEVIVELRASAKRLIVKSRELAKEAERLHQRADDLAQLISQHDRRKK
jgi:hypothetical protein